MRTMRERINEAVTNFVQSYAASVERQLRSDYLTRLTGKSAPTKVARQSAGGTGNGKRHCSKCGSIKHDVRRHGKVARADA